MSPWKSLLLNLHYHASYPWRIRRNARWQAQGRAPIIALFAHRVADDRANFWTESTDMFRRQIRWLQQHFDVVSLEEAQRRIQCGYNDRACVTLTFDDGYADNCREALPFLLSQRIPFTYFVSTHFMLTGEPFPHDVALGRPLAPNTPQQIRELAQAGVEIGGHTRSHLDLGPVTDAGRLHDELFVARGELEQLTGTRVRYFAFPFGQHRNLSQVAFEAAHAAGYEAVCSAYGGFNFPGDDSFHIQRIHLDENMTRMKNWVTGDPRKLLSHERFQYDRQFLELPAETVGISV
jgi:peptidoglycan/xylan/chitin deacetylase (PgdA/CDA1 family)